MTIRRLRNKNSANVSNSKASEVSPAGDRKRNKLRRHLLETLEPRQLMAVGPQLIGVQPNNSDLIENGVVRNVAPRELTFRFDDAQVIDAATVSGIRVTRAGGDGTFGLPSVSTDLGTNGRVDLQFTSRNASDLLTINVSRADLGAGAPPTIAVSGSIVSLTLNSRVGSQMTAAQLVNFINTSTASSRVTAKINGGLDSTLVGAVDPATFSPVRLTVNNDLIVQPGAVVIGDRPNENEVTLRFAENLPDDMYRLEVFGFDDAGRGIRGLRNTAGDLFVPSDSNSRQDTIEFRIDLGSKITAVVPQPVVRNATGVLEQLRDTIVVYFDDDKLLVENDANGNPTARSVENTDFYDLLYSANTVRNTDDISFKPISVRYNASANTATLRFAGDIDSLPGPFVPSSTFRLRVGTRETTPLAPVHSEAAATAISDLNTNGAAKVRFTSKTLGESGSGRQVQFVKSNNAGGPTVSLVGNNIVVDVGGNGTTVDDIVTALQTSAVSSALISTNLEPGSVGSTVVGNLAINYSPVTMYGLGSTFETSTNLGTIGSSAVPMTSLMLTSSIDPEAHVLDMLGAANDPGQRIAAEQFENHINPNFGGDDFPGIRTIAYNFRTNYGSVAGVPLANAITEKQKERVREAFALWSNYLGVQFVETATSGLTIALGSLNVLTPGPNVVTQSLWGVRIDPTYQNGLAVFSADNSWTDNYGEAMTRTAAASIGMLLGLSYAGNLDPAQLLNLDTAFLNFPPTADRNFEPVLPGNQDVLHGQYIHRPEGSDIDLYRFDIDFGPNGQTREGVLVAETFAERAANSSTLDTRLALYKETQASAVSNLGAGQGLQVEFTAVRPGKLGNNLQIFVTRSDRGANALPIVNAFPNAITIDLNSTPGEETTADELIKALDGSPAARALVKVKLIGGAASTVIGNRDITYSPITLTGGNVELISQNDNYFSKDSLLRLNLTSGVYYIGVSASGNDQYDPTIANTGYGGRTEGKYDLRVTFRAQTDSNDSIQDVSGRHVGDLSVALDGDADGIAGGVYNFWFQTTPLDRTLKFNAGGSAALEGQIVTVTGGNGVVRRFEFSVDATVGIGNTPITYTNSSTTGDLALSLASAINSRTELGVTAVANGARITLKGERLIQLSPSLTVIDLAGKTIFVDKSAGPNADGSLAKPFNNISNTGVANAFAATVPGDIVRIVGNGGSDGKLETSADNFAYEVGFGLLPGSVLADGPTMDVPKGVTVMVDAGAVFKMRRSRIGVGSSTLGVDRSGGALQVLGAPILLDSNGNARKLANGQVASGSVFFTSWLDESIGLDNYSPVTTPANGDWGGLMFKRDLDKSAGRFDLEDEGIFRQYVNHADIRYGGSSAVVIDSVQQIVNPVQVMDMRPTITFNRITRGADAAISATPDSFEETLFSEPEYQRKGVFTPDYNRVGLEIHDNILVNNSINGLFIKVSTPAGGDLKQLTVPGRFDDIDITHVIAENIFIQGNPGAGLLDESIFASNLISLSTRTGGVLNPGIYNYKLTFVDKNGYETVPTDATQNVNVQPGTTAVTLFGLPGVSGEYVSRRLYRSDSSGGGSYRLAAELDGNTSTFVDLGVALTDSNATLLRDRPNVGGVVVQPASGGNLAVGSYNYKIVMIDEVGRESLASAATVTVATNAVNRTLRLTNLPSTQQGYAGRRIYRSAVGGSGVYTLVAELMDPASASVTTFSDNGASLSRTLSPYTAGNIRPRLDASLMIDPGTIIKLEGARIEIGHSAQLLAEGVDGSRVIFTSKQDDRFGIGGTFDTNNNGINQSLDARAGDWSGVYASPGATFNLDHAVFAFAGGVSRIEGTFKAFSPVELQQANSRVAHTTFENNANGIGGQGLIDRLGRPANENYPLGNNASRGSTLFIRGTQPVVLGNVFQNNAGTAMTIDANAMDSVLRGDSGRQSGSVDRNLLFDSNHGPLFRENRLFNNGINGLEIRGDETTNNLDGSILSIRDVQRNFLTTESIWDDTDIVHVLFDSIVVSNIEHSGGLRLQSAINESLVIKLFGAASNFDKERGTGISATGYFGNVPDRIGGTVHVLGQPGFPVVMTSLRDDTVGAGTQPDGRPQTDTNNDGIATVPRPGDWRSLMFDTYSNDRNVTTVMEVEPVNIVAPGTNDSTVIAQFLGTIAPNTSTTDENLPLGYVVNGVISEPNDQDVYSFVATAGTEVWLDVDKTTYSLDTVIEVLNANGDLLARSDDSTSEQVNSSTIERTSLIDPFYVNPLVRRTTSTARRNESGLLKDDYTVNPRDAGLRVLLPGVAGAQSTYFFRIRSKSINVDNSAAGLTSGSYTVQLRLRDQQEFAGSVVQYANIRYATNGVHASGLPAHSPLGGEASYAMYDNSPNDGITNLGSMQYTDKGAISIAGNLNRDMNRYQFTIGDTDLISASSSTLYPIVVDVDYADGLNRPDTTAVLFGPNGIYIGTDTTAVDDLPGPLGGSDLSDLSRGSVGTRDAFIGTIGVPAGTYELAIGSQGALPVAIARNTVLFDDSLEFLPYRPIRTPAQANFIDTTLAATDFAASNDYLWRVQNTIEGGHGGTTVFGSTSVPGNANRQLNANNGGVGTAYSVPITFPTEFDLGERVNLAFNYQFDDSNTGTTADTFRVFATAVDALGVPTNTPPAVTLGSPAATGGTWQRANFNIGFLKQYFGTTRFRIGFEYNSNGTNGSAAGGVLMDDFYVGVRTPRYAPLSTYRRVVNERFEGTASNADVPVLFSNSAFGTGSNLWHIQSIGPSPENNYSGSNVLAFETVGARSMAAGASGDIVSNDIDLSNESGTSLNFSYDFTPHDDQERLDVFVRIPNQPDTLVASTSPGAAGTLGVNLARTNGQWEQARISLARFESNVVQLVFRYDTSGANNPGTGDTGHAYIDDIIIGKTSNGQQVTNGSSSRVLATGTSTAVGEYQVEIRRGDDITNQLPRNFRGSYSTSLFFAPGLVIPDHSILELSDGANRIPFEFTYDGSFNFGNAPIKITASMTAPELAVAVRDAINQVYLQNRFRIRAANSNRVATGSAGLNSTLNLFGDVSILQGANLLGPNGVVNYEGIGDVNVQRDQGQFVVTANTITDSRDYAVWSAPADKYYQSGVTQVPLFSPIGSTNGNYQGAPSLGGSYARVLPVLNTVPFGVPPGSVAERAGMAPGIIVTNNIFDSSGIGGLHIQGDTPIWRITAIAGQQDNVPGVNDPAPPDHSGTQSANDGNTMTIDFARQRVTFEFEDIAGAPTGGPAFGSGVVGGNGWNANNIPIYYREDGGVDYLRPPASPSGYSDDEVVKAIRDSILGSVLVTNGTTQHVDAWVEPIVTGTASIIVKGPDNITHNSGVRVQRLGEYTLAPFVRATNNTILGKDGRAPFNAQQVDSATNDTIAGATETWQGTGANPVHYTMNGTLTADPLSTGSSDIDIFKFEMKIGDRVIIDIDTLDTAAIDTALKIFDSNGQAQIISIGTDPTTVDSQPAPGETIGKDPYIDFTATKPGVYYVAVSSSGNTTYDPLSMADRLRGKTSGNYSMDLHVISASDYVITVDDPASYADGETFTISQVADLPGTNTQTRTFEFTRTGNVAAGNVPVYIGPEYRVPDVARAIAGAINAAGMLNIQSLDNGSFGTASPLAPVSAIALGGLNGHAVSLDIPAGHGDVGINSGRPATDQVGLNRYPGPGQTGANNDESPSDIIAGNTSANGFASYTTTFRGHFQRGIGHDRTMSLPFLPIAPNTPLTALGNGTTEKFVIIRNASAVAGRGNVRVSTDTSSNNNLNQLIPESGILVTGGGAPTLLNNVFVNVQTPIVRGFGDASVRPSAVVVGGSIYQYFETATPITNLGFPVEASPTNVPNTALDFNFTAGNTEQLFVDAPGGNFLPARGSRLIDSSIDSLAEREAFRAVKGAVGIAPSPVLAPDRDNSGQLRADDPTVAPPSGLGGNVFKDRGALDRADFVGPSAVTIDPVDNDAQNVDSDKNTSVIKLEGGVYPEFRIQLKDGFETSNLQAGTGIDDDSVVGRDGGNRLPGSVVTITENGRLLVEGIDYVFSYDTTTNEIVLKPLAGIWKNDRVYDISLNNKDRFVVDAPAGDQIGDGRVFTVRDSNGGNVTFEYDSGFRLQMPQGIQLNVPLAGGGAGGIADGDRFVINNGTTDFTFEFDNNNNSIAGNRRISFTSLDTKTDIANSIVAALATVPGISSKVIGNGDVFVGAVLGAYAETSNAPALTQPKQTTGLLVPALGTRPGGIVDGQTFSVSDGRLAVVFEFDSDRSVQPGNVAVDISSASTAAEVAVVLKRALDNAGLALATQIIDGDTVYLGLPNAGRIDVQNTRLLGVGVSRSLVDGQSIVITRTVGNVVTTRTFELTTDNVVGANSIPVQISVSDTQSDVGTKLSDAIFNAGLGLTPRHVGDGNIFVGGTSEYAISVANAPTVGLFGKPGVQGNTTLDIFGTLLLQVPTRGGADIVDNSTFTINNNNRIVTFEFDSNFSGATNPNNVLIRYSASSTAADIVTFMINAISSANLAITPRDAGGGRVDLGLLDNSAVNVQSSGLTITRGSVQDGDYFTITDGVNLVTFEFENLSVGNGRNNARVAIRYNNQSTRAEVFAAMQAAIGSSTLGLATVIEANGLRLLDTAKYSTNIDNAPSLRMTGVPGGSVAISFVQDQSFTSSNMRDSIVKAINDAFDAGRTTLQAKVRGGSTLFVEDAINISPEVTSYFLRGIADNAGNFLKSNRINNETQFTIMMPGVTMDFGDAPDPVTTTPGRYPTTQAFDGARHVTSGSAVRLGALVSSELDGKPSPLADADLADDGVRFNFQGATLATFNKNVDTMLTVTMAAPGVLNGWIDFNADGDWTDPGENVFDNVVFTGNTLVQTFAVRVPATAPVPANAVSTFARFRASTAGNLLPTGLALDGEVEDYMVQIVPGTPPVGVADTYNLNEDQAGGLVTTDPNGSLTPGFIVDDGVLANDSNPDNKVLIATLVSGPSHHSSFVFRQNGTFDYVPIADYFGQDSFVYIVGDGVLSAQTPTTVTINVRPVNDTPTAANFQFTIDEDAPLPITEATVINGSTAGPANEGGQVLKVLTVDAVSSRGGSITLSGGVITYIPPTDFSGTDSFTYTLVDDGVTGNLPDPLTSVGTINVTVRDKNDAPITTAKVASTTEDTAIVRPISFLIAGDVAGPASEAGQTITFIGVQPTSSRGGQVTVNGSNVTYTPAPDFNGTDTFFYIIEDNGTSQGVPDPQRSIGTVTVSITAVNDAPRVIGSFGTETMVEDAAERSLNLSNYFFDPDVVPNADLLTYTIASNSNPNLIVPTFGGGNMFLQPKADQNGQAVIVVRVNDRAGAIATSTLTVSVSAVNDAPRLAAPLPNLTVNEDDPATPITLSPTYFFDPDVLTNGDRLTFVATSSNTDIATVSINGGVLTLSYVPNASGRSTITVRATDLTGNVIEDSFDVTVTAVNDAPTVVNDTYATPQGVALVTTDARGILTTNRNDDGVLANDRDPEGNTFTARVSRQPTKGTVVLNADGTFTYTPSSTALAGTTDTFGYEAVDSAGAVSTVGNVTISFGNPPAPPHQNPTKATDVNADGFVSPIDVLLIVNFLNASATPSVPVAGLPAPPPYRDVNGNNIIEPLDILIVINEINARGNSGGGEGEGAFGTAQDIMPNMVWSSDVLRESVNVGVGLVDSSDRKGNSSGRMPANAAMPASEYRQGATQLMTLEDYLASYKEDEEIDRVADLVSAAGQKANLDSLDSVFADIFGD